MENKTFTPLTTDEILDRAYHREPSHNPEPTKTVDQITAEMTAEQKELYEEMVCEELAKEYGEENCMSDDEAEAYAQGFVPYYGGSN